MSEANSFVRVVELVAAEGEMETSVAATDVGPLVARLGVMHRWTSARQTVGPPGLAGIPDEALRLSKLWRGGTVQRSATKDLGARM